MTENRARPWFEFPFYPLALALYPVLSLAEVNQDLLALRVLLPLLAVAALAALGLQILLLRRLAVPAQAGAALATGLLLFFSYGHLAMLAGARVEPIPWLPALWLLLFLGGLRVVRGIGRELRRATPALNAAGAVLLLLPAAGLLAGSGGHGPPPELRPPEAQIEAAGGQVERLPDVYYIVLDGYGRSDTLQRLYGYNNQGFLESLEAMGFFVARSSFANYNQTVLSLPATLNLNYLQAMRGPNQPGQFDFWMMVELTHNNQALKLARGAGYETVGFKGEHALTEIRRVDEFWSPALETPSGSQTADGWPRLPERERLFWETTALRPLLRAHDRVAPEDPELEQHRQLVRYLFTTLPDGASDPEPQFIYAHTLVPHPPFVFEGDGSPRRNFSPYTIADGSDWVGRIGTADDYIDGYRDQLPYVNQMVLTAVDEILARSSRAPIIVIQADHGPGAHFNWESQRRSDIGERMEILTAVYLPPASPQRADLYDELSPVNTMRLTLNAALGAELPLLRDRAYFSTRSDPFDFSDVTLEVIPNQLAVQGSRD